MLAVLVVMIDSDMHVSMDIQQAFVVATSTSARVPFGEAKCEHIPTSSTKSMHAPFSLLYILP
jgi:hypothetical protein